MKKIFGQLLVFVMVYALSLSSTFAQTPPVPGPPTPPVQGPIDGGIYVILVLAVFLGLYFSLKRNEKRIDS